MLKTLFLLAVIVVGIQGRSYFDPPVNSEGYEHQDPPPNWEEAFMDIQEEESRSHIPDIAKINRDLAFKKGMVCDGKINVHEKCINPCNGVIDDYETDENGCYVSCECKIHYDKLYQGDIKVSEKNKETMDYIYKNLAPSNLDDIQNGVTSQNFRLWPIDAGTGLFIVPYEYSTTDPPTQRVRNAVDLAIADFNSMTCVRFRPRTSETNHILIQNGSGCSSFVGRQTGSQPVTLANGCGNKEIVIHEFMHAIGFQHEQSRPDRNSFVTVFLANVESGFEHNFDIALNIDSRGSPYDYYSLMHYGTHFFSSNDQATLLPTNASFNNIIGQGTEFSVQDLFQINHPTVYNCPATTTTAASTATATTTAAASTATATTTTAASTATATTTATETTTAITATTATTATIACADTDTFINCLTRAYNYECTNAATTVSARAECRETCGLCGCKDNFAHACATWSATGYCTTLQTWMSTNCRRSCGICS
uniref:Metalloendopeptidase n=1 Tax=Halocynthia roretzi TaxID=7729 RepID=D2CMF2_HALRO|nr:metalloproteinase [Halocynthia roretzi]